MSNIKIELNSAGIREMLKSEPVRQACMQEASRIASRAGDGYVSESRSYPERSGAAVYPNTPKAAMDNLRNNTLLKAMGGGT